MKIINHSIHENLKGIWHITEKTIYQNISKKDIIKIANFEHDKIIMLNNEFFNIVSDKINNLSLLIDFYISLKKQYVNNGNFTFNKVVRYENMDFDFSEEQQINVLLTLTGDEYKSLYGIYKQWIKSNAYNKARRNITITESINLNLRYLEKQRKKYLKMRNNKIPLLNQKITQWDLIRLEKGILTQNIKRLYYYYYRINTARKNYILNLNISRVIEKFRNDFLIKY